MEGNRHWPSPWLIHPFVSCISCTQWCCPFGFSGRKSYGCLHRLWRYSRRTSWREGLSFAAGITGPKKTDVWNTQDPKSRMYGTGNAQDSTNQPWKLYKTNLSVLYGIFGSAIRTWEAPVLNGWFTLPLLRQVGQASGRGSVVPQLRQIRSAKRFGIHFGSPCARGSAIPLWIWGKKLKEPPQVFPQIWRGSEVYHAMNSGLNQAESFSWSHEGQIDARMLELRRKQLEAVHVKCGFLMVFPFRGNYPSRFFIKLACH